MYCISRIVYSRYLIEITLREMATRVPVPAGELLCVNELERKLTDLSEQVALKKEEVRSNFQQFHHLLSVREEFLLKEMDDIVTLARQEVTEKKGTLQELYKARTPSLPIGIALTDEYIFVSTGNKLVLKLEKSSNETTKSVTTENDVRGIETNSNSDIYLCEFLNRSIIVFDRDLKFLKRIKLNSTQVTSNTNTYSIKLYDDNMYVMFGYLSSPPPFHLQIFTLEGELVRCLIKQNEIHNSHFFSID